MTDATVRDAWFGEEYLAPYPERDDREAARQAGFACDLLAPHAFGGTVRSPDLACGTGRHAVALDRDDGGVVNVFTSFGDVDESCFDRRRSPRLVLLAVKEARAPRETRAT